MSALLAAGIPHPTPTSSRHVFEGPRPGPTAIIQAGIHGDEIAGVHALQEWLEDLVPKLHRYARLDHLGLLGLINDAPLVQDWYGRCRQRPRYQAAIRQWENKDYLALMQSSGERNWPKIRALMRGKD